MANDYLMAVADRNAFILSYFSVQVLVLARFSKEYYDLQYCEKSLTLLKI